MNEAEFARLPSRQVPPDVMIEMLRRSMHGTPKDVALVERVTELVCRGESIVIDLDSGEIWSRGVTDPPQIHVVMR